ERMAVDVRLGRDEPCGAGHAGVAASLSGRRRQSRRPDRRGVHVSRAGDGLAVGPADVGHLLGMGCAADLGPDPVFDVSRPDRAVAGGRRSLARRARRGDPDAGRRDQSADHQILGGLVEYAASAGLGDANRRTHARPRLFDSAAGDGGGVFIAVRHAASRGDAQRDPAPAGARVADDASQPASGVNAMSLGPYASFIVTSYLLATVVVLILIAWIAIDYRRQKTRLSELDASGVVRRSGRSAAEVR